MNTNKSKELKIGLSVLGALVILYFGIEFLKGHSPLNKHTSYYAVYDDVLGLSATANVTISGVKVGQVSSVSLLPGGHGKVLVEFSLDTRVDIPEGSTVEIDKDLLGTSALVINLGTGTKMHCDGDTLPGVVAGGLMSEVSAMMPAVTSMIPKVDSLLVNVNNVAGSPAITATLDNLAALTNTLRSTVTNLDRSSRQLPGLISNADSMVATLNSISMDLKSLSSTIAEAPIDSTLNHINAIAANLNSVTEQLGNPDSSIGQLLNSSDVYDNLKNVTADIDSLIVDIKKNPKRYISIKLL